MKKLGLILAMLMVFGGITLAQATTSEMRDYFETLSSPLSAQSTNNQWTFHNKDHKELFLTPHVYLIQYNDYSTNGSIIGGLVDTGDTNQGVGDALPTFDGIFVHSGASNPTVAVFHAPENM